MRAALSMFPAHGNNESTELRLAVILLLIVAQIAGLTCNPLAAPPASDLRGLYQPVPRPTTGGQLLVLDKQAKPIPILPGLLDETLLLRGSFSFDAKTVRFDKLKVLGNVYVRRINGRLLRDAYLLKGSVNKKRSRDDTTEPEKRSGARSGPEELKLQILK